MSSFLDPGKVSLSNIDGGAIIERFDYELKKCLENVMDPNTDSKKKRSITLKITLAPSEDRDFANAEIKCESTLAPLSSLSAQLYIGRDIDGSAIAKQANFKQRTFADFQNEKSSETEQLSPNDGNVTQFERKNGSC
jgi:hypothetical protein